MAVSFIVSCHRYLQNLLLHTLNMLNNDTTVFEFLLTHILTNKCLRFLDPNIDHFNSTFEAQYPVHARPVPA